MKAMILGAGLGKRMRPLTEHTPKPLLKVNGRTLIEFHLARLKRAGITEIVVNTHWLADKIHQTIGDGSSYGVCITYSHEDVLLETAGGIAKALPILTDGSAPFLVINGDVFLEFDLPEWLEQAPSLDVSSQAYLAMVDNPDHHPDGDFCLDQLGKVCMPSKRQDGTVTYAGLALFHPSFFEGIAPQPCALGPVLREKISLGLVKGGHLNGFWLDVGTPERLAFLERRLS